MSRPSRRDKSDRPLDRLDKFAASLNRLNSVLLEYRWTLISMAVRGTLHITVKEGREQPPVLAGPRRRANIHFHRAVFAAEVVDRHQDTLKFGRVKLQKVLTVAELHLNLNEIQSNPVRAAAGQFDNRMMRSIHKQLETHAWFRPVKGKKGTQYEAMSKRGSHRNYFDRYWGDRREQFDRLIALMKPMTTRQAEIVATLYAAWNDFIIKGRAARRRPDRP